MSYTEYIDLYETAQEKGKHHMFIFDIKNSSDFGKDLSFIEKKSKELVTNVYQGLKDIEKENGTNILHIIEPKVNIIDTEPFQFGDLFGFTIIRNSINKKIVYQLFDEECKRLNIYWEFHMIDGYYETDNYSEGNIKYYRGYCIQQLEDLSKIKEINKKIHK